MNEPTKDERLLSTARKTRPKVPKVQKAKPGHIYKIPAPLSFDEAVKMIFEEDGPLLERLAD